MVKGTATRLNEVADELALSVFPNPASDKIELNYTLKNTNPVIADVYDIKGNKVLSIARGIQIAGAQKLAIDINQLASGSYNVVLKASGSSVTSKFIKK